MRVSYSQFAAYRRCPHRYQLQFVDRVAVPVAPELHFGAAVHDALNRMYAPGELLPLALEEIVEVFIRSWRGREKDIAEDRRQAFFEEGVRLLQDHYQRHRPGEDGRRTVATELRFHLSLPGGHSLGGRIDRVDILADKRLEVIDYKTSRSMPPITLVEKDAQLAIYRMAADTLYPGFEVTTSLFFLLHDHTMAVRHTQESLEEVRQDILDAVVSIELEEFDPRPGPQCDRCSYRAHCTFFRPPVEPDGLDIDVEAALHGWAEADVEEREAKARKEQAKALIHRYLDACDADRVERGGYVAERRSSRRVSGWDVERLRAVLEPLGIWDRVTQVSTSAVKKVAGSAGLSREQRGAVEEAAQYAETTTLRVKACAADEDEEIEEKGE